MRRIKVELQICFKALIDDLRPLYFTGLELFKHRFKIKIEERQALNTPIKEEVACLLHFSAKADSDFLYIDSFIN